MIRRSRRWSKRSAEARRARASGMSQLRQLALKTGQDVASRSARVWRSFPILLAFADDIGRSRRANDVPRIIWPRESRKPVRVIWKARV